MKSRSTVNIFEADKNGCIPGCTFASHCSTAEWPHYTAGLLSEINIKNISSQNVDLDLDYIFRSLTVTYQETTIQPIKVADKLTIP